MLVGCLTSPHHASVSQGWICSDNCVYYHAEMEVADQSFYLTLSIKTLVQPVPALTLKWQVPGMVATGVPMSKSLVSLDLHIDPWRKQQPNQGHETDVLQLGQQDGLY